MISLIIFCVIYVLFVIVGFIMRDEIFYYMATVMLVGMCLLYFILW